MALVSRRRAARNRVRTDLQSTTSSTASTTTPRRSRPSPAHSAVGSARVPVVSMDEVSCAPSTDNLSVSDAEGTVFFNDRTEVEWVLRGGRPAREAVAAARAASRLEEAAAAAAAAEAAAAAAPARSRGRARSRVGSDVGLPRRRDPESVRRIFSGGGGPPPPTASPRDRRVKFRRAGRGRPEDPDPRTDDNVTEPPSDPGPTQPPGPGQQSMHAFYDTEVDHHWRLPIGKPLRRADLLCADDEPSRRGGGGSGPLSDDRPTRWSIGTTSESDMRVLRANAFQADRSDRRAMPSAWRGDDSGSGRPRDRTGGRIGNGGARWRGLLARKDLVDGKADAYAYATESGGEHEQLSPRSSLDIEEANSLYSWDEPPSTSVRGWRSNHSLSYRPKPNDRPRHIKAIGRQKCINDLTDIVDASNEPCVSYDRQIFDPVSKLWTYVEASQPSSSPWELRTVGSPVTCSVSGTEEAVSSAGCRGAAPASARSALDVSQPPSASASVPPTPAVEPPVQRRNSQSPTRFVPVPSAQEAQRAFMATRDRWLGYSRKSVYGPANLEAVIFASEMDDVEEDVLRRTSMV